jgi:hypothetical protein
VDGVRADAKNDDESVAEFSVPVGDVLVSRSAQRGPSRCSIGSSALTALQHDISA